MKTLLDEILAPSNDLQGDFEISGPVDDRKPMTYFAPWRYICQIRQKANPATGAKERFLGTGTLIGKRTILTAAHVLWNFGASGNPVSPRRPDEFIICQGRNGPEWLFRTPAVPDPPATLNKIVFSDGLQNFINTRTPWTPFGLASIQSHGYLDYAIIHLNQPIGDIYNYWTFNHKIWNKDDSPGHSIWLYDSSPSNVQVNVTGYPGDKGYAAFPGTKGDFPYWDLDRTIQVIKDSNGKGRLLEYMGDVMPGMSGAPVYIKRSPDQGGRVLIGVQSSMVAGTKSTAVFINREVQNFIKKNTI